MPIPLDNPQTGFDVLYCLRQMFGECAFAHQDPTNTRCDIGWKHTDGDGKTWFGASWWGAYNNMANDPNLHAEITKCRWKPPREEDVGPWMNIRTGE